MGGSASIESDITVIDVDTGNVVTKIRNINLKKLTLAGCRNKLIKRLNAFYFVDANGVEVLPDDEVLLATKIMKSTTLDLCVKLEVVAPSGSANVSIGEIRSASSTATVNTNIPSANGTNIILNAKFM